MPSPRHLTRASVAVLLLMPAACCLADSLPLVQAGRAAAPPRLDGKLDDPCWTQAALLTPFVLNNGRGLASQQTVARLCWDDRALYLACECFERALAPESQQAHLLKQSVTAHDGNVFDDESVEIFLRPGGSGPYYQLAANMRGTRYESRGMDAGFDGPWEAATSSGREAWVLEAAVPFASLGATVKSGDRWTLNLCRNEQLNRENSTWSGLQGGYHAPEQFGSLVLAESTAGVRPLELTDLSTTAAALRLALSGGAPALQATVTVSDGTTRRAKAAAPPGARLLTVPYPAAAAPKSPSLQYEAALADGTVIYRSPQLALSGAAAAEVTGELSLSGGGMLLRNGEEVLQLPPGRRAPVRLALAAGENVIALRAPGGSVLRGALRCGEQDLGFARGWRWSTAPPAGWERPGSTVADWAKLAPARPGEVALPAGAQVCLRRTVTLADRRERFWPLQSDLCLPRNARMFVKPLLGSVGIPPVDYTYYLDVPAPLRIIASDALDGASLQPLQSQRLRRGGRDYTRYALRPLGTLTGGYTLEVVWKSKDGTGSQYVSALSLGGNFDWRDFSVEVTSPAFADCVGVLCLKWQNRDISGTCWYDDISFTEKGTDRNLLPQGDFESAEWQGKWNVVSYERDGKQRRACRLTGTPEQADQQAGLWVSIPEIPVKPRTRYVVRMRAKGENIVAKGDVARAALLAEVGSPRDNELKVYSHYEALDGQIVEAERETPLHLLPALKGRAPRQVPIIACYDSAAYESADFWQANAAMVRGAGINWLWGSNQSPLADLLKPQGMKFVWPIDRDGFAQSPVDNDYLKRHPEHAAVQRNAERSAHQICPTVMLDTPNEFLPKLREWLSACLRSNPYDLIDWDHEFPTNYPQSICFCPTCRAAFAAEAKLPAVPTTEQILASHVPEWTAFRCRQNARMAGVIREACRAAAPQVPFSVYSGYQNDHTLATYGVDWALMRPHLDWAIAGYNGDRSSLQHMRATLGDVPFTGGQMYVEKRFQAERPYPSPQQWRLNLLRTVLDSNGGGFLIWYLPVLDGAGYWGIGWVAALVADFEDFFTDFQRHDELVVAEPAQDVDSLAVLTHGRERLIIALNPGSTPRQFTLAVQGVRAPARLTEYETNRSYDPSRPVALSLQPGEVKVLHLSPR